MKLNIKKVKFYLIAISLFAFSSLLLFSFIASQLIKQNSFLYFDSSFATNKKLYFISFFYLALAHILGTSTAIILISFLFYLSILYFKKDFYFSIDRWVGVAGALIFGSLLSELSVSTWGGLFGYNLKKYLLINYDPFLIKLWVVALFIICLTLATYSSFVALFAFVSKLSIYLKPVATIFATFCNKVYLQIKAFGFWITSLYNGKILRDVNETDIEYNEINKENISFWSEYFEKELKKEPLNEFNETIIETAMLTPMSNMLNLEYRLPTVDLFTQVQEVVGDKKFLAEIEEQSKILESKLEKFGISGKVVSVEYGPVVTLFEYEPNEDSKLSKIVALEDDLAMALQATSIRILAPIPGKAVVGFEVANKKPRNVYFSSIINSDEFKKFKGYLPIVLGEDTIGKKVIVDLSSMPHLLVAGSTGSGKSVALNTMLISLLCKFDTDELKLILIDPKRLEFASYHDIAHLLFPIVTNSKNAVDILKWLVKTMEDRYQEMAALNVKNIFEYYASYGDEAKKDMPFIVLIIDELADLIMTSGKEVEFLITRIAQMARAAGIHMIVATQRPSVDVITGLIKVNFPSRISFRVTSKVDSRTILDATGAEKLLGRGDMLFLGSNNAHLQRVHGAYISNNEINLIVEHIKMQRNVEYIEFAKLNAISDEENHDLLYSDIINYLKSVDEISISLLQRKFRIGYNRSARIIEQLEQHGHIRASDGSKMRKVIKNLSQH